MNPLDLWPWGVVLCMAVAAFFLLGPVLSGLLLVILLMVIAGNLLSPR
ncbi:MAG: hypothetical protein J0M04_08485 [Verrucomicrobia bacterium]|nr:hypothetical protein [Verrucomicrobiota bacterium]